MMSCSPFQMPLATQSPQLTISAYLLSDVLTVRNMRKPYLRQSICLGSRQLSRVSRTSQGPEREPRVRISSLGHSQYKVTTTKDEDSDSRCRRLVGSLHDERALDDADGPETPRLAEIIAAGLHMQS